MGEKIGGNTGSMSDLTSCLVERAGDLAGPVGNTESTPPQLDALSAYGVDSGSLVSATNRLFGKGGPGQLVNDLLDDASWVDFCKYLLVDADASGSTSVDGPSVNSSVDLKTWKSDLQQRMEHAMKDKRSRKGKPGVTGYRGGKRSQGKKKANALNRHNRVWATAKHEHSHEFQPEGDHKSTGHHKTKGSTAGKALKTVAGATSVTAVSAQAGWDGSVWSKKVQAKGSLGLGSKYDASAQVQALTAGGSASANAGVSKDGLQANAEVDGHADLASASAQGSLSDGPAYVNGQGNAFVGVNATGNATATVGDVDGNLGAKVEAGGDVQAGAFANGSATGGIGPLSATATGNVGVGAEAQGNFDAEVTTQKIGFSTKLGAAVGVGGGAGISVSLDLSKIPGEQKFASDVIHHPTGTAQSLWGDVSHALDQTSVSTAGATT